MSVYTPKIISREEEKQPVTLEQAVDLAKELVSKGMSVNEASKTVAADTGIKKSLIYKGE